MTAHTTRTPLTAEERDDLRRRLVEAADNEPDEDGEQNPPLRLGGWAVIAACLVCGALILAAMAS